MCGLIGISVPNVTAKDIEVFNRILIESRIRGLHATGAAWLEGGKVQIIKAPMGPIEFLAGGFNFADCIEADGSINLIAHTRYSTSDLEFNQPIGNHHLAIVHNGVISQELPENWPKLYGVLGLCDTSNDTELLFRSAYYNGGDTLEDWPDASIAALELWHTGNLRAYRNGRRPLYMTPYHDGWVFTSTADIPKRAGLINHPSGRATVEVPPYHYAYVSKYSMGWRKAKISGDDLQHGL